MRQLIPTLALLSLAGCLSAKQEDALEQDSHLTAGQTNESTGVEEAKQKDEQVDDLDMESESDQVTLHEALPPQHRDQSAKRAKRAGSGTSGLGIKGQGSGGGGYGYGTGGLGMRGSSRGATAQARVPRRSIERRPPPTIISERSTEEYTDHGVNPFTIVDKDALSTFSIDVDTASYTIARRKLEGGVLPPWEAVRVEEFVNYLDYKYESPSGEPFKVHMAAMPDPFRDGHHIMRVGVQAKRYSTKNRPPVHLTFLADVSGSMSSQDKLPLAKEAMHTLVDNLREDDTVALATYAGRVPPRQATHAESTRPSTA